MPERTALIDGFLHTAGWGAANNAPLAGDASNRRYLRLTNGPGGQNAVLMDAPRDRGEDIGPFVDIAQYLTNNGFSAPQIIAQDRKNGFLLLEDLGDQLFARHLTTAPQDEMSFYAAAVDVLAALHQLPPPELAAYDATTMAPLAGLAGEWYARSPAAAAELAQATENVLRALPPFDPVIVLRDYHSENLLWLPQRSGLARVGLLDFQDAMLGHPTYDLVSLIYDARRDVGPDTATAMIARYASLTGMDVTDCHRACAAQSAQRNLRILGVFARLCLRDGKPGYLEFLPRVWRLLMQDLSHPDLAALKDVVLAHLSAPDPWFIERLRAQCPAPQPPQ